MALVESKFNCFVNSNTKTICYNTFTDSIMLIPSAFYEILKSAKDLNCLATNDEKIFHSLIENGFLIDDSFDELKSLRFESEFYRFTDRTYHLTILPTLDCNLRCWYCFEQHAEGSRLSQDIIERILRHTDYMISENNIDTISLDWFGGEPLMYFEEDVYPIAIHIKRLMEEKNKKFSTFFTTNSVTIIDKWIPQLAEINASFQITLDGYREKHNTVRFSKKNEGTYDQIISTIHKLVEQIDNAFINVRINFDNETLDHIEEVISDLNDIDRRKVRVHLERVWQTDVNRSSYSQKIINVINLLILNGFDVSYTNFRRKHYSCMTDCYHRAAISYDGKVYKCIGRNFTDEMVDGHLTSEGIIEWDNNKLAKRLGKATYEHEMCLKCKFLSICMGPCSQKNLERSANIKSVCALRGLEMTMDNYIRYKFNNEAMKLRRHQCTVQN